MTSRNLYAIYLKLISKIFKIYKGLFKSASTLIGQIKTEKIGLQKLLHFRKMPGFDYQSLCADSGRNPVNIYEWNAKLIYGKEIRHRKKAEKNWLL